MGFGNENRTKTKKSLSQFELSKLLTQLKKEQDTLWLKEVNAQSLQQALIDLDAAYTAFFKKQNKFPKFKKKKKEVDTNGQIGQGLSELTLGESSRIKGAHRTKKRTEPSTRKKEA